MGASAFDWIKLPMGCAKCGKEPLQPLAKMVDADSIACTYCGAPIDLTDERTRAYLREKAEVFKQIKPWWGLRQPN